MQKIPALLSIGSNNRVHQAIAISGEYIYKPAFINKETLLSLKLNAEVNFKDSSQGRITCRHLSTTLLDKRRSGQFKSYFDVYHNFNNENSVAEAVGDRKEVEKLFQQYIHAASAIFILENPSQWNLFLEKQFDQLEDGKRFYALINTFDHAMVLEGYKSKNPSFYQIDFYDPNYTAAIKTYKSSGLENICNKSMVDFLADENYYSILNANYVSVHVHFDKLPDENLENALSIGIDDIHFDSLTSFCIYSFLKHNFSEALFKALGQVGDHKGDALTIFQATHGPSVGHALFEALYHGHTESIEIYMNALIRVDCSLNNLVSLLDAVNDEGCPGLVTALEEGKAEAVSVYMNGLYKLRDRLSDQESLKKLLTAKYQGNNSEFQGYIGWHWLFTKTGAEKALIAYIEGLKNFLSTEEIFDILSTPRPDGNTVLYQAFTQNNTELVKTYLNVISDLNLSPEQLFQLVLAQDNLGHAGLVIVLHLNYQEILTAYYEGLSQLSLSIEHKKTLFLSHPAYLYLIFSHNQSPIFTEYFSILSKLDFTQNKLLEIARYDPNLQNNIQIAIDHLKTRYSVYFA
jgi:hypothetical protein